MDNRVEMAFVALNGVYPSGDDDLDLGSGFSLVKPNDFLLSARERHFMSEGDYGSAATASRYLVYRHPPSETGRLSGHGLVSSILQNGLIALQILKPIQSQGFIFYGTDQGTQTFNVQNIEIRGRTDAGEWARMRSFDADLLEDVASLIPKLRDVMAGQNAEKKNAVFLLQLGLEHRHGLIAGLLWVMGLEALLNSNGKYDFKKKLSACLGADTLAFPDWNSPTVSPPPKTVADIALDLHMLRSTLAHGLDLRKAAKNKNTPVDLLQEVSLTEWSQPTRYCFFLSEAACYLLCAVLQKQL